MSRVTHLIDYCILFDDGAAGYAKAVARGSVVLDNRPATFDAYRLRKHQKDNKVTYSQELTMLGTRSAECKGAECVVRASEMNGQDQEASLGVYNSAGLVSP